MRIRTDGKDFSTEAGRFRFRGVTYGTFRPRTGGVTRFPSVPSVGRFDLARVEREENHE